MLDKVRPVKERDDLKERSVCETLILVTREEEEEGGRDGKESREKGCMYVSFPQEEMHRGRESGKEELKKKVAPIILKYLRGC